MLSLLPVCAGLLALASPISAGVNYTTDAFINYTTETGYFLQDDPSTNATTFNFTAVNFGLIKRTYPADSTYDSKCKTQWQRFAAQVALLQKEAPAHVQYKLLYMGRHGDGYHNDAEAYYGTPAWNCYYSERDGNGTIVWGPDAHLSPLGVTQALTVNTFWKSEIAVQKIPTPQSYYTSPLTRCLQTANYTFNGLDLPKEHPFIPEVKELFRESISGHTCDERSNKTYIHETFPTYTFEPGFSEYDLLWVPLYGETNTDQVLRSKVVLDDVFTHDNSTYISIISHSGEIGAILEVLGHQPFGLNTGAAIPVLVRAETFTAPLPATATMPYTSLATCATAPTITASACDDCSCCTATPAARRWA